MLSRELCDVVFKEPSLFNRAVERARKGKSSWPSREAAKKWLSERAPWKTWDGQAFNLMMVSYSPR